MPSLLRVLSSITLLLLAEGCADSGQTISRRGEVAASIPRITPGPNSPSNREIQTEPTKSTDFTGPTLVEAKNNTALTQEFQANIALLSKVSATEIVLFGKNGRSWQYNPAAEAPPKVMEPAIVKPEGFSLFTLPDSKFWLVGPQTLGRRKAVESAGGVVSVENFNTSTIKGDWAKVRVLYVALDSIILQLDSSIAILAIRNGTPSLSQFSSTLPVALDGGIVAAGETESGGYWFASKETLALLEMNGLNLAWSRAKIPLTGHEDYSQAAMRIDSAKKQASGEVLLFQADKYWSVTGSSIQ